MNFKKHRFWLVITLFLYSAFAVVPALAHAELIRSNPEANTVLAKSPEQIELLFSEPLEAKISTIQVYDSNRAVIDLGDAIVDESNPGRMTVSLPSLPDGIYIVSWAVISQIDGHQTAGSFPFAIGNVDTSALPAEQSSGANMPISALVAKWILLVSAAIITGQYPSRFFVWHFTLSENTDAFIMQNKAWDFLYRLGLYGILLSFGLGVLSQAGQTTGHELAYPWASETTQVLTGTRLGTIWLLRLLLVLLGFLAIRIRSVKWRGIGNFVVGLALLLAISLTSHSATELRPLVPIFADWIHLIGMAFWFGGLVHLIIGLTIFKRTGGDLRTINVSMAARQFSMMAIPSVVFIGITGIYSAYLRVGTFSALFDTVYGHSLLFKQGFAASLLLIAGANLLVISPGLKKESLQNISNSEYFKYFRRTVLLEIVLAGLLLVNVTVMTYLPPVVTPLPQTTLNGISVVDDLKIALFISPGLVGQNTYEVRLSPGRAANAVKGVKLTFIPVTANVPPSEIELVETGNGIYTSQGSHIGFSGRWLIEVLASRPDSFDVGTSFDFNIVQPDDSEKSNIAFFPSRVAKILLILIFLLLLVNIFIWAGSFPQSGIITL